MYPRAMGFLEKLFGRKSQPAPPPQQQPEKEEEPIRMFDEFGREFFVPRDVWRREVLPDQLRAQWSDPDALYNTIVMSVSDGFASDLLPAAKQLHAIDRNVERAACIYAIVLIENRRLRDAERVLRDALRMHPKSGPLLTNLAKVHDAGGDHKHAEDTLWQAIVADPNFDNALNWYAALAHERGGLEGYIAALQRVATLEGSWRAILWLAREHAEQKDLAAARALYEKVLVVAADAPGVLMQLSGDLGRAGFVAEVVDLVLPFYEPERHDVPAGLNLLQAFFELGDWRRGEELLHRMMLAKATLPFRDNLMWYSQRFGDMKNAAPAPQQIESLEIAILQLDHPVWTSGLGDPRWLYPSHRGSRTRVAVLNFANTTPATSLLRDDEALVGPEDQIGRLTRAIPLHLADVLRFRTDAEPIAAFPVIAGNGEMVVVGKEWNDEYVRSMSGDAAWAISGELALEGERIAMAISVWRSGEAKPVQRFTADAMVDALAMAYAECETALLRFLVEERVATWRAEQTVFRQPSSLFREYLDGLGQAYALAVAATMPGDGLFGERNIHRWLLRLALDLPETGVPAIALVSTLANSRRRGSNVYRELEHETLALFTKVHPGGDLHRLSPFVFRLFDRMDEFESRRNELLPAASDEYVRWLAGLDTVF